MAEDAVSCEPFSGPKFPAKQGNPGLLVQIRGPAFPQLSDVYGDELENRVIEPHQNSEIERV